MLFLGFPRTYQDVLYVVGKVFQKEIQRTWNRRKRFSGGQVIRSTSFTNRTYRVEWDPETLIDLLGARAATCGHFRRCQGHWSKGDQGLYWNSVLWYKKNRVMIRPHLISFISLLPQWGFRSNPMPTESCDRGESNDNGCKEFGVELVEDVGFFRSINYPALIRIIDAFHFRLNLPKSPLLYAKGSPLVLSRFKWGLGHF